MAIVLSAILVATTVMVGSASAQTPEPALSLVVIGDSIPYGDFCTDCEHAFVDEYALHLEETLRRPVDVTNRSRNDGAQLNQIADQVETERLLREQLAAADLVIISAGINDGPPWLPGQPCGSDVDISSTRAVVDQLLSYTEACLDDAVDVREEDFRRLFAAVDELVPAESPVLVVNAYNWWTGWTDLAAETTVAERSQIDDVIAYFLDRWNAQECAVAHESGFVCVDLYHAFNGPDGKSPAGDLLEHDYSHPSRKGNALIANLLMELDVFSGPAATPSSMEASPTS
jgi:lysophospholipase L1-like esterase